MKELVTLEWLSELLTQIVTLIFCAGVLGIVGGITYALICLARDFKFI